MIPLGRLIKLSLFNIVLIQILLYTLILKAISFLFSELKLILLEYTMELLSIEQCIFDFKLFLMVLADVVILVQIAINPHVPSQVHCWQFCLNIDLLCESLQVVGTLFRIEQRMVSINSLLFVEIGQYCLMWKAALHSILLQLLLIEMKNKKMITESSREQKRTLRIAQSPKKVTKLKLSSLLQANKQKQMDQINQVIRQKLQDYPNTASRNKGFNPYEAIYQNDLAYWKQYSQATGRYEQGGINLKWPYYFTAQQQQFPDKE